MGLMGKLMFWKKEDPALPDMPNLGDSNMGMPNLEGDANLGMPGMENNLSMPGANPAQNLGMPGMEDMPSMPGAPQDMGVPGSLEPKPMNTPQLEPVQQPSHTQTQQQVQPSYAGGTSDKDLEIISLKLDSLKSTLEAINERLAHLEKIAEGDLSSKRRF